jgi:hypothetical protein
LHCLTISFSGTVFEVKLLAVLVDNELGRGGEQYNATITEIICLIIPCGGGLGYLNCSSESRRRRRKGNAQPGDITGPHKYRGLVLQVEVGHKADDLHCKKKCCCESKEVKMK